MKRFFLLALVLAAVEAGATVRMPQLFQNGMVLQRGKPIPVWGFADVGEQVTVSLGRKSSTVEADARGRWRVDLPPMKAGGPYVLKVNDLELTDVLIGDVWLCSGQSNIDVTVERVYPQYAAEIDAYENPRIRLFRVQSDFNTHGVCDDVKPTPINWKPVTKQNAWLFSAVGYFLGKRQYETTHVPQGVIVNSLGGTPIEAWVSADSLCPDFSLDYKKTLLYQNDDMVAAVQRINQQADQRWYEVMNQSDPGVSGGWTSATLDDHEWQEVDQYSMEWAKIGGRGVVGSLWMRQHVQVSREHAGQPARLLLGTLFDCDYTFVNGQEVGRTYYQYPPRRYQIPAGLLREGDNVLTVRFVNKYGTAHFIPEKPYKLIFDDGQEQPLSRQWLTHLGTQMPPCPSAESSFQNLPTVLYNAMLHPLAPYALSGVVWYQGESNVDRPQTYAALLRKLMGCWRSLWQQPRLPFVVVQLANFQQPSAQPQHSPWAEVREAQRLVAEADPDAELAVAIDLGETVDIHPLLKKEVADRVGLCFDRLAYGRKVQLSPRVLSATLVDGGVELTLDQPLQSGDLYEFELCGDDGVFHNAAALAQGSRVVVRAASSLQGQPRKLRYAWKDNPIRANARSLSGLPLAPFERAL